jgi:hypothetical protein
VKYWLDTEFHEDGVTIDLISIGIVAEDGREFYAVNQDAELHRVSDWVRKNVLVHLPPYSDPAWMTKNDIASGIARFTGVIGGEQPDGTFGLAYDPSPISFFAYYADYDWVVLCQLFGTMMNLPERFPKYCMDLKQLSVDVGSPKHPPQLEGEHNALADARWNRDLYALLMKHKAEQREPCSLDNCGHMRQLDKIIDFLGMPRGTRSVYDELRARARLEPE